MLAVAVLLAIGLYSSTYGISVKDARTHVRLILKAITVGVLLKAFIVGTIMTLILKNPFGYILGIVVAVCATTCARSKKKGRPLFFVLAYRASHSFYAQGVKLPGLLGVQLPVSWSSKLGLKLVD